MMEYEDYNNISKNYDILRRPIGLESLINTINIIKTMKKKVKLLDIGCGTGEYIDKIKHLVDECSGLEKNEGMINKAILKHANENNISYNCGDVLNLPYKNESFEIVIMTQVLHHLEKHTHHKVLSEIYRVLKKDGIFWISTQTPEQHLSGFWWSQLIPQASLKLANRFPGKITFTNQLKKTGFTNIEWNIPNEPLIDIKAYIDINGPFSEIYRNCDSTWSLASLEEINNGLKWWKYMIDNNKAEDYINKREKLRLICGQTSIVICNKI